MNFVGVKPKKTIFFPDRLYETRYTGEIWGKHFEKSKVFNIFSHEKSDLYSTECLGVIHPQALLSIQIRKEDSSSHDPPAMML